MEVGARGGSAWVLPGLQQRFPHDIALTAAPAWLTGAAERLFALLVAPVCAAPGCGPLLKFVLEPADFQCPQVGVDPQPCLREDMCAYFLKSQVCCMR